MTTKEEILELVRKYYKENFIKKDFEIGDRIPYSAKVFDEEELVNLVSSSLEFWLTQGHFYDEFEKSFATFLGVRFVSFVNSGSSANLLAISSLMSPLLEEKAMKNGDEVITVAATFPTTLAPLFQLGLKPVFIDVEIPTYNADVKMLESALSDKTRAVFMAHTLGNPFDIVKVKEFCERYNLWLIEDNCDALGAEVLIDGVYKKTGTIGDIGTSSFYPPHHMTTGEGGAVYTDNPLLHKIILSMRDWGRDCICPSGKDNTCGHRYDGNYGMLPKGYDHKYVYSHFGYNLKATDMQAAIGLAQLDKLPSFIKKRRENFNYIYDNMVKNHLDDNFILPRATNNTRPSWFAFILTFKRDADREKIVRALEDNNIQTRMLFAGNILKQPAFDKYRDTDKYRVVGDMKNTDIIMNKTFLISVYPGLTEKMMNYMIKVLCDVVK